MIEDYALIGNFESAALVSRAGSIDWLCFPRFDSGACFAALLGNEDNGHWLIAPEEESQVTRKYREDTLVLETEHTTASGKVLIIDAMIPGAERPTVIRIARGLEGTVKMRMRLVIRFDYGSIVPWVTRDAFGGLRAVAGRDAIRIHSTVPLKGADLRTFSDFELSAGEEVPFVLVWSASHEDAPRQIEFPSETIDRCAAVWREWIGKCAYKGPYAEAVRSSLIALKALIYEPTGGIVAAPTTSLPEEIGGVRNWDYRYCWLRDATFTLHSLMAAGYVEEACAWRDWLVRAAAGVPSQLQPLYGIAGERHLTEIEVPWLRGYEGSRPVRVGNAASRQLQLDIFGELMDTMHSARRAG